MAEYYPKVGVCYEHAERQKIYMIYTFRCNAACDHCLVQSNPQRREKLTPETAIEILETGARYGKRFLDLSGGEATLYLSELLDVIRAAKDLGYYICLNSNAYWARTPERAVRTLEKLKAAGLDALFPSASAYHIEYIPSLCVRNAREACRDLGIVYELNWVTSDRPEIDTQLKTELGLDAETIFFDGLTTEGNDSKTIERLQALYTKRVPEDIDDCLSVHMGVNPHGHVVTSCNMTNQNEKFRDTPFFLGNFLEEPFEDILRREQESPALQFIYSNPHPALHRILLSDPRIASHYAETVAKRYYFGVIDYYIDVFRDPTIREFLDEELPARARAGAPAALRPEVAATLPAV